MLFDSEKNGISIREKLKENDRSDKFIRIKRVFFRFEGPDQHHKTQDIAKLGKQRAKNSAIFTLKTVISSMKIPKT